MLIRDAVGVVLRRRRLERAKTLLELSADCRVSLPYLSEIERGRKEASSEVLATICRSLGVPMTVFFHDVSSVLEGESAPIAQLPRSTPTQTLMAA
jgi:transcriptional regulator with XRE-family HTH domain